MGAIGGGDEDDEGGNGRCGCGGDGDRCYMSMWPNAPRCELVLPGAGKPDVEWRCPAATPAR